MILAIAAILLTMQTRQASYEKSVSLDEPCIKPSALMQKLSSLTNIRVRVDPELEPEPLEIHIQNVKFDDLMTRLADAESGEWIDRGESLVLCRSKARMAKDRSDRIGTYKARYQDEVKKLSSGLVDHPSFDEAEATALAEEYRKHISEVNSDHSPFGGASFVRDLERRQPVGRMAARLLSNLPQDLVLDQPDYSQTILSSKPKIRQIPLPVDAKPIIDQFIVEQEIWQKALAKIPERSATEDPTDWFKREKSQSSPVTSDSLLIRIPGRKASGFFLTIDVIDSSGNSIAGMGFFLDSLRSPVLENYARPSAFPTSEDIKLTAGERESIRVLSGDPAQSHVDPKLLSQATKFALIHPDAVPTASLFAGPILNRVASKANRNSIAVLSNSVILELASLTDRDFTSLHHLEYWLDQPDFSFEYTDSGGWLTFRPKDFSQVESERPNIAAMATLLQAVDKKGYLPADEYARFCACSTHDSVMGSSLFHRCLTELSPTSAYVFYSQQFYLWQLYGLLTPLQKQQAQLGNSITDFTKEETLALSNFVYEEHPMLRVQKTLSKEEIGKGIAAPMSSLPWDHTEALPKGLPSNTSFTMKFRHWDVLFVCDLDYKGEVLPQDLKLLKAATGGPWYTGKNSTPTSYQIGSANRISFDIFFTKEATLQEDLHENVLLGQPIGDRNRRPGPLTRKMLDQLLASNHVN